MPTRRYPDWESFEFPAPAADPAAGQAAGQATGAPARERGWPVAFCADLSPASVLSACRRGIVPLPAPDEYLRTVNEFRYENQVADGAISIVGDERDDPYWVTWWSPDPRPVIRPGAVHLGRNVRKRLRREELTTTANAAFRQVAEECRADREPRWLTDALLDTLTDLRGQGWAHSIEVWLARELVGGAVGIGVGAVLSGDTLFGRRPGAVAVAVADMSARLAAAGGTLIDVQCDTPFLRSLGARPMARDRYLALLRQSAAPVRLLPGELPGRRLLPEPLPAGGERMRHGRVTLTS